ncbi:MAG: hypothetical protein ABFS42_09535 [Candidatus Krumholzibacteriota bacterium]
MGIQNLAIKGTPAGARLLAAFLDVSTPGDRLLPRVQRFNSSRRLRDRIGNDPEDPGSFHQDWLARLEETTERCVGLGLATAAVDAGEEGRPGGEFPWPMLRDGLEVLTARLTLGDEMDDGDRKFLVELLRLEVDARQERISQLAGNIDPTRIATISRVLPSLSMADAEIRDLRRMISMIEEGCSGKDFARAVSRSLDVLEDSDRSVLSRVLKLDPDLEPLADLFEGLVANPIPVPTLAYCLHRLQGVAAELDLVTGVRMIKEHFPVSGGRDELHLPLPPGLTGVDLAGWEVRDDSLVITIPEGGSYLEHDLPVAAAVAAVDDRAEDALCRIDDLLSEGEAVIPEVSEKPPVEDDEKVDVNSASVTELKHLVLSNMQSISVLLGLLRSPKVAAIPGLVEDVVSRTRNPKVIETVAQVRILHTGFANRTVPLAILRSPVNIPLTVLRKFIHVKYVSKVDLKRMAADRAGIRKEVGREIIKYIKSLT